MGRRWRHRGGTGDREMVGQGHDGDRDTGTRGRGCGDIGGQDHVATGGTAPGTGPRGQRQLSGPRRGRAAAAGGDGGLGGSRRSSRTRPRGWGDTGTPGALPWPSGGPGVTARGGQGTGVSCVQGGGMSTEKGGKRGDRGSQGWEQGSLSHAGSLGSWIRCRRARICLCLVDKLLSKCQHPPGTSRKRSNPSFQSEFLP